MAKDEKLKLEYSLLEVEEFINTKEEALGTITAFIYDEEEFKLESIEEAKECNKGLLISRLVGLFTFSNDEINYYKNQLGNINEKIDLVLKSLNYQYKLRNLVNEDNYIEIYKLSKFLDHNLILNYNYINLKIDTLYYENRGIGYNSNDIDSVSDNKEELFKFIDNAISKYQVKEIEKVKKI